MIVNLRNKILAWTSAVCLVALAVYAANPSFTDFNTSDFSTTGNKVRFNPGMTNYWTSLAGSGINLASSPSIGITSNSATLNTPFLQPAVTNDFYLMSTNAALKATQNSTNTPALSANGVALLTDVTNEALKATQNATNNTALASNGMATKAYADTSSSNATNGLASSAFGNASGLSSGTVPLAQLPGQVLTNGDTRTVGVNGLIVTGALTAATSSLGSLTATTATLTNVNGLITTGQVTNENGSRIAYLSDTNAIYTQILTGNNIFTGSNTFSSSITSSNMTKIGVLVANLVTPAANTFAQAYATDVVTSRGTGDLVTWDGSNWRTRENVVATASLTNFVLNAWAAVLSARTPMSTIATMRDYPDARMATYDFTCTVSAGGGYGSSASVGISDGTFSAGNLSTATTAGSGQILGPVAAIPAANEIIAGGVVITLLNASSTTDPFWCMFGHQNNDDNTVPIGVRSGVFFLYDPQNITAHGQTGSITNDWICVVNKAGTLQYFDSGLAPSVSAATPDRLLVLWTSAAVSFYTNNAVCKIYDTAANLPAVVCFSSKSVIVKSGGSLARNEYEGYHYVNLRRVAATKLP